MNKLPMPAVILEYNTTEAAQIIGLSPITLRETARKYHMAARSRGGITSAMPTSSV